MENLQKLEVDLWADADQLCANSRQACMDYLAEIGFGLSDLIEAQAMLW